VDLFIQKHKREACNKYKKLWRVLRISDIQIRWYGLTKSHWYSYYHTFRTVFICGYSKCHSTQVENTETI